MQRVPGVVSLALLVVLGASAAAHARAVSDSGRIVPWVSIGSARIGDTSAAVDRTYGKPVSVKNMSRTMPVGTRWHGHRILDRTYRVPGGDLWVRTVDGRVHAVGTTSPRYVTPRGIRVGIQTDPRCVPNTFGSCDDRWRGFVFRECTGWGYGRRRLVVSLGSERDRVERITFGDPDALLICF